MKKIWKIRKNSEAVSPVIATILMVAITVVLAAVLYVMVMGFSGPGQQTPTGSFVGDATNQTAGYRCQLGVITPETTWNSCKFSMTVNGVTMTAVTITLNSGTGSAIVALGTTGAKAYTAVITDLASDGKISSGDSISVRAAGGFPASGTFDFGLLFTATGSQITHIDWTN